MVLYLFLIIFQLFTSYISQASTTSQRENNSLQLEGAWVRAVKGGNSAGYVDIFNKSMEVDRLVSVQSDVCQKVELHTHLRVGNMYQMRPVKVIEIPSKKLVSLTEGGFHIMLINIFEPLKENTEIKLILVFEKAGKVPILAKVRKTKSKCGCKD